jgi:hypothetical protein
MPSMTFTMDLGELGEREVEFFFNYTSGRPGKLPTKDNDTGYEAEPPEVEIIQVLWEGKDVVDFIKPLHILDYHKAIITSVEEGE